MKAKIPSSPRALIALSALLLCLAAVPALAQEGEEPTALTVWWVVFNKPENCATSPCGEPDLFEPAVQASAFYATGALTDADGGVMFVTSLYETVPGKFKRIDLNTSLLGGPGLMDARKAEIHAVVRSHGPALFDVPGGVRDQLTGFLDPGCQDLEGPNVCEDVQFAVHQPVPGGWLSPVFDFADGSEIEGASSKLLRGNGVVKLILKTQVP